MNYLSIIPNEILNESLLLLSDEDLLNQLENYKLNDYFWQERLKLYFPNKPIIDYQNINLVYWYYVYCKTEEVIKCTKDKVNLDDCWTGSILGTISKLYIETKNLSKSQNLEKKLKTYIYDQRVKKYGFWPKYTDSILTFTDHFYHYYIITENHILYWRKPKESVDIKDKDTIPFKSKFNKLNIGLIFAYIYVHPIFENFYD